MLIDSLGSVGLLHSLEVHQEFQKCGRTRGGCGDAPVSVTLPGKKEKTAMSNPMPGNLLTTAMAVMPHTDVEPAFAAVNRMAGTLKERYL